MTNQLPENQTEKTELTDQNKNKSKKGKLTLAITAGAVAGGIAVMATPSARNKVKEKSSSTRNSVSQYVADVKADPSGAKNDLMQRIQKTASITKEALNKIQNILDEQGKDIKEKVEDVTEESQDIVSTAKEAGEELKDVGEKVKEAKEELTDSGKDEAAASSEAGKKDDDNDTDHTITKTPIN
ncbi:YtxH domain-containing protein [Halobacillus massiliensis]|uniref:YtxH domain-containing protein n=1 Tax=Halobacillus massiliensis TaxID=1926286 RepID=UPI0009E62C62|nr:YtxH domain-containing protein [Halobacillus massiliensis]